MRVGVLEWICGGGGVTTQRSEVSPSLVREGWLMLSHLVADLMKAAHRPVVSIDSRCIPGGEEFVDSAIEIIDTATCNHSNDLIDLWCSSFKNVDALIVIAPECECILEETLAKLRVAGLKCANCQGEFLRNTADKLRTAILLEQAGVAHPATVVLNSADTDWRARHQARTGYWSLKPRDGAGCDGLQWITTHQLENILMQSEIEGSRLIVQPWLDGLACSRSAIVDATGRCHWLPLVTQRISYDTCPKYRGGQVVVSSDHRLENHSFDAEFMPFSAVSGGEVAQLDQLLNRAVQALGKGALGWIGVDLVFHPERVDQRFTIIEINPRLTTSFVGLSQSCDESLSQQLLNAVLGNEVCLPRFLKSISFSAR